MKIEISGIWNRGENIIKDRIIIYLLQWLKRLTGWKVYTNLNCEKRNVSMMYVGESICNFYNMDIKDIRKRTRKREIVQKRQTGMFFAQIKTKESLEKIGDYFGGYDHATCLHAKKTVNNLIETDKMFKAQIEEIEKKYFGK